VALSALYLHREEHQRISSTNLSRNGFPHFSVPLKPKGADFERDSEVVFQNINLQAELCYGHAGRIGISFDVRLASMVGYD
jgi:peptide methionine sulfoxide reductase MsrB